MVPVSRVVYDVLTRLEQTFTPALLGTLFSHINLYEYPRLAAVLTSFRRGEELSRVQPSGCQFSPMGDWGCVKKLTPQHLDSPSLLLSVVT